MLFLSFGVAAFGLQNAALAAVLAPVLLAAASIVTILDDVLAFTVSAFVHNQFGYHAHTVPYITSICPLPEQLQKRNDIFPLISHTLKK